MHNSLMSHSLRNQILRNIIRRLNTKLDNIELPPEPTTCCMSGCANCVWIAYGEELCKLFEGNNDKAREVILDKISDPNLKMFLSIELKNIKSKEDDAKAK